MLEVLEVWPSGSVATVVAIDPETEVIYGVAADPRMARALLEVLSDPDEQTPTIERPDSWAVLWSRGGDR